MEDNKNEKVPQGSEMPDIHFKNKQEDISSTLQFKVADAINKARQDKPHKLEEAAENIAAQEHFVIDVKNRDAEAKSGTAGSERVSSANLPDGKSKSAGAPARPQKPAPAQRAQKSPPPQRSAPRQQDQAEKSSRVASSVSASKPKKKKWTKKKRALVFVGILVIFLFILFVVVYSFLHKWHGLLKTDDGKVDSNYVVIKDTESSDTVDQVAEEERIKAALRKNAASIMNEEGVLNILLIGEDIRDTELDSRGNTDVMMLISLDDNRKRITMTSFLRDTYTLIPGWNPSKLNAAYGYGGVELLEATLQQDYAINIDRYVIVNFYSFIEIVEAVGGLDFNVSYTEAVAMQKPLDEQNNYLKNDHDTGYIDLKQYGKDGYDIYWDEFGPHTVIEYNSEEDNSFDMHLDGNQSLAYARVRYGCGDDYGRTQRQREAIIEMINKAKKLSFSELDSLAEKVAAQVRTDITENEVAGLILNAFDYMSYEINQLQVPAAGTFSNQIIDGLDCLSVDFTANAQILQQQIYGKSNIDADHTTGGPYADNNGDGVNDYFVDNNGDGVDDNLLDLDGDGIDDRAWNGGNTNTWQ